MPDFTPELDRYEADVARRLGALRGHEARVELAAHLHADYDARLELGDTAESARLGALAALGPLDRVVAAEPVDRRDLALTLSPVLFAVAYVFQATILQSSSIRFTYLDLLRPNVMAAAPALVAIVAAACGTQGRERAHLGAWARGMAFTLAILPFLMGAFGEGLRRLSLDQILTLGAWAGLTSLLAHLAILWFGTASRCASFPSVNRFARLFAWPLGMLIVGHCVVLSPLLPWAWPLTGLLLAFGMRDRRQLDLPSAVGTTLLGILANGTGESILAGWFDPAWFAGEFALKFAMILFLQGVLLGFWTLVRRPVGSWRLA